MESSLHTLHTGLFVQTDKINILINNISGLLRTKFKVKAVSGPKLDDGKCEIIFYSLQSKGSDFASAKDVIEKYFTSIKEVRPNFVLEKKPECIDLEEDVDLSVVCLGNVEKHISVIDLDSTEETVLEENLNTTEETEGRSNVKEEVICIEDDEEVLTSPKASTSRPSSLEEGEINSSFDSGSEKEESTIPDSASCDQNNHPSVSTVDSNLVDRAILKESNRQQEEEKLTDSIKKIEVVEILDDDVDSETDTSDPSPRKRQKPNEETFYTHIPPKSDEISKTLEALADKLQNTKQAVSSILSTESSPKKALPRRKRKKANNVINLLEIPESSPSTPTVPKKKSKLSYKKPAHLIKPLVQRIAEVEPESTVGSSDAQFNIYNPNAGLEEKKTGLRPIVIDGNNVGVSHGKGVFSMKGIQICVNYFELKGHRQIKVFLPQYRRNRDNHDMLQSMERQGTLVITPSRRVDGKVIASYDDRYIVQYAAACGGIIISTDNYRDLMNEDPSWTETIKNRLLMFTWVDSDILMFPHDPLGRNGPRLQEFLKFPD